MLSIENIEIEFGGRVLMRDASFQFRPGETTGLIGRNGSGKSSLLRIIAGVNAPSKGQVHKAKDSNLAFFHQDLLSYETERSIFEVAKDAFEGVMEMKTEIDTILKEIEDGNEDPTLWNKLDTLQAKFETYGGRPHRCRNT